MEVSDSLRWVGTLQQQDGSWDFLVAVISFSENRLFETVRLALVFLIGCVDFPKLNSLKSSPIVSIKASNSSCGLKSGMELFTSGWGCGKVSGVS